MQCEDIHNSIAAIQQHNAPTQHHSGPAARNRRQAALAGLRQWLHSSLQARRQRTVALQLPLKSRGQISAALRQSGREIGIILRIAAADDTTILVTESLRMAAIIITVIVTVAVVIPELIIVIAIAAAIGSLVNAASGPDLLATGRIYAQNVARQEDLCVPVPLREPGLASLSPPL
jgi:hypothetical protein